MRFGLRQQMLAAAEADLEPDFFWRKWKQRRDVAKRGRVDLKPRQALGDQAGVISAQRLAAAAPIERAPRRFVDARQETRPRNWLERSVFSQVKPPSASGWRPKWP